MLVFSVKSVMELIRSLCQSNARQSAKQTECAKCFSESDPKFTVLSCYNFRSVLIEAK